MIFTFRQDGNILTGSLEATGGGGFGGGGSTGGAIEDGKVEGANVSFRVGNTTYTGAIKGEQIELQRAGGPAGGRGGRGGGAAPTAAAPTGPRPAIGPVPAGSDPSFGAGGGGGGRGGAGGQAPAPMILRRVTR
jgi:hypothetical protein